MLSGIIPFVFSPAFPPKLPKGLLNAAKRRETAVTTAADTPTATTALAGLGTQICCARLGEDEGAVLCVGLDVGLLAGVGVVDEAGVVEVEGEVVADVDEVGVGEADVPAASDTTETVPEP